MAGIKRKQVLDTPATTSTKKVRLDSNKSSRSVSSPHPSKKLPRAREQLRNKSIKSDIARDESFEGFSDKQEDERLESDASSDDAISDGESAPAVKDSSNPKSGNKTTAKLPNGMLLLDYSTFSGAYANSESSREAHAKQKVLAKERKASKPNADQIHRAKKIWERLRIKSNVPQEERQQLLTELFELLTGRVHDFVFKHDAVRTIQCALKYSTMPQRIQIAGELKGSYCQLAESRYAKFLVAKLITKGNERIRDTIIPEFYGHVRRLINHPEASWILDDIYRGVATTEQKAVLLREWYGPDFVVFKNVGEPESPTAELSEILASSPEKTKPILDYLRGMINQLVQKKLTGFTMLHDAMLQYFLNVKPGSSEAADFLRLMIGDKEEEEVDLMRNLAFTKSGSRLACLALAYGTAKDRRQLLRAYKDTTEMLACDKDGHSILLTAYDVVDDTREISSRIFSELVLLTKTATEESQHSKILALVQHQIGHMSLLYPFAANARWLIPPRSRTGELLKEIHQIRSITSKKNPATRQKELVAALSPLFLSAIAAHAQTLSESSFGCHLITETLISGVGDKDAAVSAVADLAAGDPSVDGHISMSRDGGRMLKVLVNGGHFDQERKEIVRFNPELHFAQSLYERIKDWILEWAISLSSFVVVALLENDAFKGKEEVKKQLRAYRAELEGASAGTSVEKRKGLNEEEHRDGKKHKNKGEGAAKSNAGAQLILKMLDE